MDGPHPENLGEAWDEHADQEEGPCLVQSHLAWTRRDESDDEHEDECDDARDESSGDRVGQPAQTYSHRDVHPAEEGTGEAAQEDDHSGRSWIHVG